MQTQLNQPNRPPSPVTQVATPLNQNKNVDKTNSAENKRTKKLKTVVLSLGVSLINLLLSFKQCFEKF